MRGWHVFAGGDNCNAAGIDRWHRAHVLRAGGGPVCDRSSGNGAVNASDIGFIKSRSGRPVDPTNFRLDVTADGSINATDVALVKASAGTGPP
ncbi:MAG: hypothetical protein H0V56_06135 [Chthoniobacterales bacterium]|nr:hypothetical protein [Chthoniobacterales bacterium]